MTCWWRGRWSIEIDIFICLIKVKYDIFSLNNPPVMLPCVTLSNERDHPRAPDAQCGTVSLQPCSRCCPLWSSCVDSGRLSVPATSGRGTETFWLRSALTDHRGTDLTSSISPLVTSLSVTTHLTVWLWQSIAQVPSSHKHFWLKMSKYFWWSKRAIFIQ